MRLSQRVLLLGLVCCTSILVAPLATKAQPVEKSATYVSQIDSDLTIRHVTLLPVSDNLEGIYARPIEAKLLELIRSAHRWDFIESGVAGAVPALVELEEKPEMVQQAIANIDAEAAFAASATRGPTGLSIRIDLFLKKDGKLIAQEIVRDLSRFEIPAIKEQVNQLYRRLISKLPYDGLILSRQGNRVTINLGKSDGIKKDQNLTAVQIVGVTRHPKFGFILSTDKEIIGRIKVLKVDDTLSFGSIISEKERNAVQKMAKISGVDPVNYPVPDSLSPTGTDPGIGARSDAPVTFGANPKEWLPVNPPSFGQVSLMLGAGTYAASVTQNGRTDEAASMMYPSAHIAGELWLNPQWIARTEIRQGIVSTSNPDSSSDAGTLNHLITRYSLSLGYNFLLRDDFFGPKIQVSGGYYSYRVAVAESELMSSSLGGFQLGVSGSFPVSPDKIWFVGGGMNVFLNPSATDFRLFLEKKIAENMRAIGSLDFSAYKADKDDASVAQKHMILSGGIVYMF